MPATTSDKTLLVSSPSFALVIEAGSAMTWEE
jgi:hypothetical protein